MRFIKTFVLHIYFDPEVPERLCGEVRSLEDTENRPFKNRIEFDALLRRLVTGAYNRPSNTPGPDSGMGE
jgi:hypothetical protein